jgi:hypothetical protein
MEMEIIPRNIIGRKLKKSNQSLVFPGKVNKKLNAEKHCAGYFRTNSIKNLIWIC